MPRVVWVACDEERAKELRWIIAEGRNPEAAGYFVVHTVASFGLILNPSPLEPVDN